MPKTRNFKQHTFNSKRDVIKLTDILNETKKITNSVVNRMRKNIFIDEVALNGILKSGVLGKQESIALREFFIQKNINRIDEVNFRRIDENINLLQEDWWESTKSWVKQKKDEYVNAIKAGWAGVKKIWSNFKALLTELAELIKTGLKNAMKNIISEFQAGVQKFQKLFTKDWYTAFKSDHPHEHSDIVKEAKQLRDSGNFMLNWSKTKLVGGEMWEGDLIAGNGTPKGEVEGDENIQAITKDATEIAQESYRMLFKNKNLLSELANKKLIIEGHLEDALKNHPTLQAVIKWGMLLVKAVMSPAILAVTKAIEFFAKNIFKGITMACKGIGGPGIFEFAILTLMGIEVYEVIHSIEVFADAEEKAATGTASELVKMMALQVAQHIPGLDILVQLIKVLAICIAAYSLGTILYNLISAFKSKKSTETGEEPEVQTAGYKPSGQFKLKEGKLVFIS